MLIVVPIGLVFGRLYQRRSGRLAALVLAHGRYDFLLFALFAFGH
ncbi:MAG: hypothetical protein ACRDJU_12095 [Actinomycetota bacterium]